MLNPDRYFSPDITQRQVARNLYAATHSLPLICPHGHVEPGLFSDPSYQFGSPTELLIIPDHYVFRMLYSQGISLDSLGITHRDSTAGETDHRKIWRLFAKYFYLFQGTPTGIWFRDELSEVFGISTKLDENAADEIYDAIAEKLKSPDFSPRALYDRFNIEVLCTTDAASDPLSHHQAIRASGWHGRILPTFRPDTVVNLDTPGWMTEIQKLEQASNLSISGYPQFIQALENRRAYFISMGATATDHAAQTAYTCRLTKAEASMVFARALAGGVTPEDARIFTGHMLIEMARMSTEDGLVMQLHIGSYRNHNPSIYDHFGPDKGADIPLNSEFTRNLKPLLDTFGNHPNLRIILFNLDETNYTRELAPLAGHYPVLRLGPPWWFHDSLQGMERYFNEVMETAGIYNTAGFNDDTRAYPSIPIRHDVWRRAACNWLAGLVVRHIVEEGEAHQMAKALAYDLAKNAYNL